jgi:hypothetical protein
MIVSINQPAYLPWLGYFHRIAVSDLHIVLDHVQFEKNSFTNRNKIRTKESWQWLTVPLRTKGHFGNLGINHVEIEGTSNWAKKHWAAISQNYDKALFFAPHASFFEQVFQHPWTRLNDLLWETTAYLLQAFGIRTPLRRSSEMDSQGHKDELVLDLCRKAGATHYLSGALGRDYLREPLFAEAGIRVSYQAYRHPQYTQLQGGFEPFMGAMDLLFNHGPDSLAIILNNQEEIVQ